MTSRANNNNYNWHDVLLKWFEKWLYTYKDNVIGAYDIINRELIPTGQYERASVWIMHVFDVTVLTHQMLSLVHETEGSEIRSVYRMRIDAMVDVLKRLENQMIQCRNTFDELLTLNAIDRMYTGATAAAAAAAVSNSGPELLSPPPPSPAMLRVNGNDDACDITSTLPTGVVLYAPDRRSADLMTDMTDLANGIAGVAADDMRLADLTATLELLRAGSDRAAVRAENLDRRLPPNDVRTVFMAVAPGDGESARMVIESYLAKLKETVDGGVRTYRVDYGGLLSKWRGESEKNFETLMRWMVDRARQNALDGRGFDALWLDNVHVLMGQRGGDAEDFLSVIKTTMLQIMDVFNKDKRLSRFALIFSTGARQADVDSAFRRRMDAIYELPSLAHSPSFRNLVIRHTLRVTQLNVEGDALARLNAVEKTSELQSTVYSYYVRARFTIGTEFYIAKPGAQSYSLQPLKRYYNLNGVLVRTGGSDRPIMQAVKQANATAVAGGEKLQRCFYRPGEVDPRNLSKQQADNTVYVIYDTTE